VHVKSSWMDKAITVPLEKGGLYADSNAKNYSGWDDSEVGLGFIRKLYISMHLSRKLLSREIVAGLDRKV